MRWIATEAMICLCFLDKSRANAAAISTTRRRGGAHQACAGVHGGPAASPEIRS
jgi:hypothetical protein